MAMNAEQDPDQQKAAMTSPASKVAISEDCIPGQPPATTKTHQRLQILSTAVVFMNTWGVLLAFGAFQTYYEQVLLRDHSTSSITWISTLCAFLLLGSGTVTGPLFDHGWLRPMVVAGGLLQVFGVMMISLSKDYYQLFLSQGLTVGIGAGLLYIPSIAAVSAMFEGPKRARIIGLISSASGVGGVFYPVMFRRLLASTDFAWAVRSIGFVVHGTYILSWGVLLYPPQRSPHIRALVDRAAFTDWAFVFAAMFAFFGSMAYYLPLLYLPTYAETAVYGFPSADLAFYLLSIVNGASVIGRLSAGLLAMSIGPVETCALTSLASLILLFSWITVKTTAGIIVWSVFWGLVSSIIIALPAAVIPLFTPDPALLGTRNGMFWLFAAVGILIGAPIGGALIDIDVGGQIRWWYLQIFAGLCMLGAALCSILPVIVIRKREMEDKNARRETIPAHES